MRTPLNPARRARSGCVTSTTGIAARPPTRSSIEGPMGGDNHGVDELQPSTVTFRTTPILSLALGAAVSEYSSIPPPCDGPLPSQPAGKVADTSSGHQGSGASDHGPRIRYLPGSAPAYGLGTCGLAVGAGVVVAAGAGFVPTFASIAMKAAMSTAAATSPTPTNLFMGGNLRAGHQARRWGVVGTWSSTASRTRSGSAVTPSSSHDRTMRVVSRSVLIAQPPA